MVATYLTTACKTHSVSNIVKNLNSFITYLELGFTYSREERLLILSCPSLSLCPLVSERLPRDGFAVKFDTGSPKYFLFFLMFSYCWQLSSTHRTHCCSSITTLLKRTSVTIYKSTWPTILENLCLQVDRN